MGDKLTQLLTQYLLKNYKDKLPLIMFDNIGLFTDKMYDDYISLCKTEHGKQYLKGGSKYKEEG